MKRKVYALLVGINRYPIGIRNLKGCINDIGEMDAFLSSRKDTLDYYPYVLKNEDATRENIIGAFRQHLSKAEKNDLVLFHFCGHGSRQLAAPEFISVFPEGIDETLVCYNSRINGGFDLADKELILLIDSISLKDPEIVIILDCCHSGSGTRYNDESLGEEVREENPRSGARKIQTYLNGFFSQQKTLELPKPEHLLIAACSPYEKAIESPDGKGLLSFSLLETMKEASATDTYVDLFRNCRKKVRDLTPQQTPQFEAIGGFWPYTQFLDGIRKRPRKTFRIYKIRDQWRIEAGAMDGLNPKKMNHKEITVTILEKDRCIGEGKINKIGFEQSELDDVSLMDEYGDELTGEVKAFHVSEIPIYFSPIALWSVIKAHLKLENRIFYKSEKKRSEFGFYLQNGILELRKLPEMLLLQYITAVSLPNSIPEHLPGMMGILRQILKWKVLKGIQTLDAIDIEEALLLKIILQNEDEERKSIHSTQLDIFLPLATTTCRPQIFLRHKYQTSLHLTLLRMEEDFSIYSIRNSMISPDEKWALFFGDSFEDLLQINEKSSISKVTFKIIASETRIDDHLIVQPGFKIGGKIEQHRGELPSSQFIGNWATITLQINLLKCLGEIGTNELQPPNTKIRILQHSAFRGSLYLSDFPFHFSKISPYQFLKFRWQQHLITPVNIHKEQGYSCHHLIIKSTNGLDPLRYEALNIFLSLNHEHTSDLIVAYVCIERDFEEIKTQKLEEGNIRIELNNTPIQKAGKTDFRKVIEPDTISILVYRISPKK